MADSLLDPWLAPRNKETVYFYKEGDKPLLRPEGAIHPKTLKVKCHIAIAHGERVNSADLASARRAICATDCSVVIGNDEEARQNRCDNNLLITIPLVVPELHNCTVAINHHLPVAHQPSG